MSLSHSVEQQGESERATARRRADPLAAEPSPAPPISLVLGGPVSARPAVLLQRQAMLGNAHVSRVFRTPAATPAGDAPTAGAPEEKKDCDCADKEQCSCGK